MPLLGTVTVGIVIPGIVGMVGILGAWAVILTTVETVFSSSQLPKARKPIRTA